MMEVVEGRETRTASPAAQEPLVCRRVVSKGVVVAALHPVAGPVYWYFVDESDCNAPDAYGVTDNLAAAKVFKSGYYRGGSFLSFRCNCLSDLSDGDVEWDGDDDEYEYVETYDWAVEELAKKAGCTPGEFVTWLHSATWVEYPAPQKVYFLSDFNGFMGYRPEWTEHVEDALHWSREELADKDDVDVALARSSGNLVPLSQAMTVSPVGRGASKLNYALEADYAFTRHRLGLHPRRDWSRKESGMPSWLGDLEETAWIYAARAGVEHVRGGEVLPVSGHIAAFPELLERFEMAAALARHEAAQAAGAGVSNEPNPA